MSEAGSTYEEGRADDPDNDCHPADHQILVEPACAVCLTPFYDNAEKVVERALGPASKPRTIIVIVCGGSAVSLDKVASWRKEQKEVPLEPIAVQSFGVANAA